MSEKSNKYGLRQSAKAYRKPLQWQVDSDYLDKLGPADREWMLKFQEAEYGGNGHLMHDDQDEQRRLWVQQKKQQRDAMTFARSDTDPDSQKTLHPGVQPSPEDALIEAMDRQAAAAKVAREEHRKLAVAARKKKLDAIDRREAKKRARKRARRQRP